MKNTPDLHPGQELDLLTRIATALEKIAENTNSIRIDCELIEHSLERLAEEHGAIPRPRI
jgi:hypothetical protein